MGQGSDFSVLCLKILCIFLDFFIWFRRSVETDFCLKTGFEVVIYILKVLDACVTMIAILSFSGAPNNMNCIIVVLRRSKILRRTARKIPARGRNGQ